MFDRYFHVYINDHFPLLCEFTRGWTGRGPISVFFNSQNPPGDVIDQDRLGSKSDVALMWPNKGNDLPGMDSYGFNISGYHGYQLHNPKGLNLPWVCTTSALSPWSMISHFVSPSSPEFTDPPMASEQRRLRADNVRGWWPDISPGQPRSRAKKLLIFWVLHGFQVLQTQHSDDLSNRDSRKAKNRGVHLEKDRMTHLGLPKNGRYRNIPQDGRLKFFEYEKWYQQWDGMQFRQTQMEATQSSWPQAVEIRSVFSLNNWMVSILRTECVAPWACCSCPAVSQICACGKVTRTPNSWSLGCPKNLSVQKFLWDNFFGPAMICRFFRLFQNFPKATNLRCPSETARKSAKENTVPQPSHRKHKKNIVPSKRGGSVHPWLRKTPKKTICLRLPFYKKQKIWHSCYDL